MKVFLSHSSKNKGFVESAASLLRAGTYELDSKTFDMGKLNSQVITESLRRSDLFCLFLSSESLQASYVNFETLLGVELMAQGAVKRFLVICLDDESFDKASSNIKLFNIRKCLNPDHAARLIRGCIVAAAEEIGKFSHPFVGREEELVELERQVTDHNRSETKAVFISGNFGSGRRTIARKFYEQQYPQVSRSFPVINIDELSGFDFQHLYRKILMSIRPAISSAELKDNIKKFNAAAPEDRPQMIAEIMNGLLPARESALLVCDDKVMTDAGDLAAELKAVIQNLHSQPYPPAIVVTTRMVPTRFRNQNDGISYLSLKSLKTESSARLLQKLARDHQITLTNETLARLVELSDNHPFNIYQIIGEVAEKGVMTFLANPRDYIEWKHRATSEYLKEIAFSPRESGIMGLLVQLPELDLSAISDALNLDPAEVAEDLLRLSNLHIVEATFDIFQISPVLRTAVERDKRFKLPPALQKTAMLSLAQSLDLRLEDGTGPVSLVDAAVISSLESGQISDNAAIFLLPSHCIWMAKRYYDQKQWEKSKNFALDALKRQADLSNNGFVTACRFACLSAARLGDNATFDETITKLKNKARDSWTHSQVAFLQGFNLRLKGRLPQAEMQFRECERLSPGNYQAEREIAAICLVRGNLDDAERFAREAYAKSPANPFVLDILLAVLVRRYGKNARYNSEIDELFDALQKVGEEGGRSFFTTRKAEFEHLWGDNKKALQLVSEAVAKTPRIFEVQKLYAEILMKDGNRPKAAAVIGAMREMVNARDPGERKTNYRSFLVTEAHYLVETGRYDDAKKIYDDQSVFTEEERSAAIKDIQTEQTYRNKAAS